jgi:hypothetical protein
VDARYSSERLAAVFCQAGQVIGNDECQEVATAGCVVQGDHSTILQHLFDDGIHHIGGADDLHRRRLTARHESGRPGDAFGAEPAPPPRERGRVRPEYGSECRPRRAWFDLHCMQQPSVELIDFCANHGILRPDIDAPAIEAR